MKPEYILIPLAIIVLLGLILLPFALLLGGVLATRCGGSHPWIRKMRRYAYAHRGLHDEHKPENSLSAFRAAVAAGYGIELDVHLLKDGTLAVIHDFDLQRVTGQKGTVENLDAQDLWNYRLIGSQEIIPTLKEVLDLVDGTVPLIIELKCAKSNYAALCQAVCDRLENYQGLYCLESFDPRCIRWLKKNRPDIMRGQLAENYFHSNMKINVLVRLVMTFQWTNFLSRPHFVAYKYADRNHVSNLFVRKLWGATRVTWTVQNPEEYRQAKKEGWITIFENFKP